MTTPFLTPEEPTRCGHVALAGAPNVGKSSLLNALVDMHMAIVSPKAQATRMPVTALRTDYNVQAVFHDLPGLLDPSYLLQASMRHAALDSIERADLVLYLHPANEAPAPPFARVARLDAPLKTPVRLIYTKGDLVSPERRAELELTAPVYSAKEPAALDALMEWIGPLLPEGPFQFDANDLGTQPMRFFVGEYLREAAFELLDDEVPYSFTAAVEEFREAERPMYIRATLYVERDSQKGIVVGKAGRTIKAIGEHARKRLEELTGAPIFLDTWVKVLPKWRRDAQALKAFGFPVPEEDL